MAFLRREPGTKAFLGSVTAGITDLPTDFVDVVTAVGATASFAGLGFALFNTVCTAGLFQLAVLVIARGMRPGS